METEHSLLVETDLASTHSPLIDVGFLAGTHSPLIDVGSLAGTHSPLIDVGSLADTHSPLMDVGSHMKHEKKKTESSLFKAQRSHWHLYLFLIDVKSHRISGSNPNV